MASRLRSLKYLTLFMYYYYFIKNALFFPFIVARMVQYYLFSQTHAVDMRVDFCSRYTFVPQHCLYYTQVCTAFKEMCGKRVTEGVRAHILFYTDQPDKLFYEVKDHDTGKWFLEPLAYEDKIFVTLLYRYHIAVDKVSLKLGDGTVGDRHETLFVTLSGNTDETLVEIEIGETQTTHL